MNNIIKKFIFIIINVFIILTIIELFIPNITYGVEWWDQATKFSNGEIDSSTTIITPSTTKIQNVSKTISGALLAIATVIAVITTAVLGISFIIQSAEGKAKVKEAIVPLVIGMIVSFGAFAIWTVAINIFGSIL